MKKWIKLNSKKLPSKKVLVTNNLEAVDSHGTRSHVWITHYIFINNAGKICAFDASDETIHNLTHYHEIP
jgi:hypothetical protein